MAALHFYTGVGYRRTPSKALLDIKTIARCLQGMQYVVRTGGADGADTAFERAVPRDKCILYLPWRTFNGPRHSQVRGMAHPTPAAHAMAATVHPAWERLKPAVKALHARNCHQVLGGDLMCPSDFVVCWTPDGCESEATRTRDTGGTATAIVLASRHGIPVFNLANGDAQERLWAWFEL